MGLSPPTRGNLYAGQVAADQHGSIPAHAGEPQSRRPVLLQYQVYPRPRGGTLPGDSVSRRAVGLSPPTRGNLSSINYGQAVLRSIPAHAGEPALT